MSPWEELEIALEPWGYNRSKWQKKRVSRSTAVDTSAVQTQIAAVEVRVDEVEKRQEKTEIELARNKLDTQRLKDMQTIGVYVGVSPCRIYTKLGFGDPLDDRVLFRMSKAGGEWIILCKTYGVLQSEERNLHKLLAKKHEVSPGSKEIYFTSPALVADLRLARVLDAEVKDDDFFQGTIPGLG